MSDQPQDAQKLAERIHKLMEKFEKSSSQHLKDESFVALDASSYTLLIKLHSPFGNGETVEKLASTNELQQRINHWISVQRELGDLGAVRVIITPDVEQDS